MQLCIGKNLKELRRARDLTQEELAGILCVTSQAVSKWERGDGCPDIALLPGIASFFGVTLDTLFGMEDIRSKERLEQYHAQWKALNGAGENEDAVRLMREALREFPGESMLTVQLVTALEKSGGSEEARAANRAEAIALSERLARDGDPEIRNAFLFNLCHSYWTNGDTARALEHARKLPGFYKTKENALVMFLQGDEKLQHGREGMLNLTGSLFHQCLVMSEAFPPEDAIVLLEACCAAAQALYPNDDVPELLRQQAMAQFRMAEYALRLDRTEEAMEHLHHCAANAVRCRTAPSGPRSLLSDGLDSPPSTIAAFRKIGLGRLRSNEVFRPLWDAFPEKMEECRQVGEL